MTEQKAVMRTAKDVNAMRRALNRISNGESVRGACKKEKLSRRSFLRAVESNPQWRDRFAFSTTARAHYLADSIIDIADGADTAKRLGAEIAEALREIPANKAEAVAKALVNASVQRDRLRVDSRKWVAAKLMPAQYGAAVLSQSAAINPPTVRVVFEPLPPWAMEGQKALAAPEADWEVLEAEPKE